SPLHELERDQASDDDRAPEEEHDRQDTQPFAAKDVHRPASLPPGASMYWICPGFGGRRPFRAATAMTRGGAAASASSARSLRFSSSSWVKTFNRDLRAYPTRTVSTCRNEK